MPIPPTRLRPYPAVVAALAWSALAAQLLLFLLASPRTTAGLLTACGSFLTYFTVWANTLVALAATGLAVRATLFFARPPAATAAAVYILVVAIVDFLFLRPLWQPVGAQRIVALFLHDVIPLAYLLLWLFAAPRGCLRWRHPFQWLFVPFAFAAVNFAVGLATGSNAYPFLDLTLYGPARILTHIALLALAFLLTGVGFLLADRRLCRRAQAAARPSPPHPINAPLHR